MEQFRLLLAIGLSFLVLFIWSMFFVERQPMVSENQEAVQTKNIPGDKGASNTSAGTTIATISKEAVDAIKVAQTDENPGREISVETPFYTVRISAKGASFNSYILKKYRETVEKDSPNKQLIPPSFKDGVFRTSLLGKSLNGLDSAVFSISQEGDKLVVDNNRKDLSFNWVADDGTILTKTYTFDPDSYLIGLKIILLAFFFFCFGWSMTIGRAM